MAPMYSQKTMLKMASVRDRAFVVTSSYCIRELHFILLTLLPARRRPQGLVVIGVSVCAHCQRAGLCPARTQQFILLNFCDD